MSGMITEPLKEAVKYWWLSLVVGILSLVLGFWFVVSPLEGIYALAIIFIASFIVVGISEISFALSNKTSLRSWGWVLTNGILSLAVGLILWGLPSESPLLMIYFVGFWIMLQSIWGIGTAFDLQFMGIKGWGWLMTLAILGVLFSILFITMPKFGGAFILTIAAVSFIMYGLFRIGLAMKLKAVKNDLEK